MSCKHGSDRVVAFDRGGVLFVFNLNANQSFPDYKVGVDLPGKYKLVLDSDEGRFGGQNRLDHSTEYFTTDEPWANRRASLMVRIRYMLQMRLTSTSGKVIHLTNRHDLVFV